MRFRLYIDIPLLLPRKALFQLQSCSRVEQKATPRKTPFLMAGKYTQEGLLIGHPVLAKTPSVFSRFFSGWLMANSSSCVPLLFRRRRKFPFIFPQRRERERERERERRKGRELVVVGEREAQAEDVETLGRKICFPFIYIFSHAKNGMWAPSLFSWGVSNFLLFAFVQERERGSQTLAFKFSLSLLPSTHT